VIFIGQMGLGERESSKTNEDGDLALGGSAVCTLLHPVIQHFAIDLIKARLGDRGSQSSMSGRAHGRAHGALLVGGGAVRGRRGGSQHGQEGEEEQQRWPMQFFLPGKKRAILRLSFFPCPLLFARRPRYLA